jgi:hypothetical protein
MTNMRAIKTAGMILAGILAVSAQDTGWMLNGSLALPVGTAHDAMGLTYGVRVGGAYEIKTAYGYSFRPGLTISYFGGKGVTGVQANADYNLEAGAYSQSPVDPSTWQAVGSSVKTTLLQTQIVGDLIVPFSKSVNAVVGISVSKYIGDFSGGSASTSIDESSGLPTGGAYSPVDLDKATYTADGAGGLVRTGNPNGSFSIPGLKIGVRLGVEVAFSKQLSGQILFQQTELGRMVSIPGALNTVNPSTFEVGVVYKF